MANKYEEKIFEPINNKTYEFREVSVNGRFLFQEFIDNLKDTPKRHEENNAYIRIYE